MDTRIPKNIGRSSDDGDAGTAPTGWNWFDDAKSRTDAARAADTGMTEQDVAVHYANALSTKSGKIMYNDLMRYAFSVAGFDPSLGFYNAAAHGFYRQGMGELVSHIHALKIKGEKLKTKGN